MEAIKQMKTFHSKICMEAVKQNGHALYFVKDQTNEICMEAVNQNGMALRFVKIQTNEICAKALEKGGLRCTHLIRSDILQTPTIQAYILLLQQNAPVLPKKYMQPTQSQPMYQYTYTQPAQPMYQYTYAQPAQSQSMYQYTYAQPAQSQSMYQYTYPQYYYVPLVSTYYR